MKDPHEKHSCCHGDERARTNRPFYRRPFMITVYGILILLGLSYVLPALREFRFSFLEYARIIYIPVLLGFLFGGIIDYYVPHEYVSKYLSKHSRQTIFYAAGLGFLMSACNHGILALSMALHKKGASGPAVASFLLASPWANLPMTFLLLGFFGWKGFLIIFFALFVAISTGLVFQFLDKKGWIEQSRHTVRVDENFSIRRDIRRRWKAYHFSSENLRSDMKGIAKGIEDLVDMVLMWILIGMAVAALSDALVPAHIFQRYLGPTLLGLFVTLIAATILEVCSEGTSPLAFEIYQQTGAFGNAFVFLMAGVVTDYTEIGMIWKNLGRRTALWLLAVSVPQVLVIAWFFNTFLT